MRLPVRFSTSIALLFTFIALAVICVAFAPSQLGGQASYVIVNGNSMEPVFHTGDLVIVRHSANYRIGDVVAYQNADLRRTVIHRIIDVNGDRYILQGDHNTWIDSYYPNQEEILGKQWIFLPGMGEGLAWLRSPLHLALAAGLLGGILMASLMLKPSPKNKRQPAQSGYALDGMLWPVIGLGFLSLLFLIWSIIAFTRPLTGKAQQISYTQVGLYAYSAVSQPGVYDENQVRSGDPIFPRLTCQLNLAFDYHLVAAQPMDVSGTFQLTARVKDEQSGWQRSIALLPETGFKGSQYLTKTTLDLCQIEALVAEMEQQTGIHPGSYSLTLEALVTPKGKLSGEAFQAVFAPQLAFKFDKLHFYQFRGDTATNPLHTSQTGFIPSSQIPPNTLQIFGFSTPIWIARVAGLIGLTFCLFGIIALWIFIAQLKQRSQFAFIRFKYGELIADAYPRGIENLNPVVDVTSIDDLVRVAERLNTLVLHYSRSVAHPIHYFCVMSPGLNYRYVLIDRPSSAVTDRDAEALEGAETA